MTVSTFVDLQVSDPNNIIRLLTAMVTPLQDIEDAFQALESQRFLATAVGAQLDLLGRIVDESRQGLSDADYARYLSAKIIANRSQANTETLIKICVLILNNLGAQIVTHSEVLDTVFIRIANITVQDSLANILIVFLRLAAAAGVRVLLETNYVADSLTFMTAIGTQAPGSLSSGATSIPVTSTTGCSATGSLDIDYGLAVQETVTYTGTTPTSFTGVSALAHNHTAGAAVQVHDVVDDQGFAVAAVLTNTRGPGTTILPVDTTFGFPASGIVLVDYENASVKELLAYSAVTSTTITVAATVNSHSTGALIRPTTGLLGGRFASVREALYTTPEVDYP